MHYTVGQNRFPLPQQIENFYTRHEIMIERAWVSSFTFADVIRIQKSNGVDVWRLKNSQWKMDI